MKLLYLNCAAGVSGDMAAGALIDAGGDILALKKALSSIPLDGFETEIRRVKKSGIDCCDFNVILDKEHENHDHDMGYLYGMTENHAHHGHHHAHRSYADIKKILAEVEMTPSARELAEKIFKILAEAEAKAHCVPPDEVHFHEVGAVDSIVDIVACAVLYDSLHTDGAVVPALSEGTGNIRCQHGVLPVPVPAVVNIVRDNSLFLQIHEDWAGERVTPTGAAFAAAIRTKDALPGALRILSCGYGAGKRDYEPASILRAMIVEADAEAAGQTGNMEAVPGADVSAHSDGDIWKLETNIDDCTGEQLGFVMDCLMKAGARDVHFIPCFMKKNRPAWILSVIADESKIHEFEDIIFRETTTIGIRRWKTERTCIARNIVTVPVMGKTARVKVTRHGGDIRVSPEYNDVVKLAGELHMPYSVAYEHILKAGKKAAAAF